MEVATCICCKWNSIVVHGYLESAPCDNRKYHIQSSYIESKIKDYDTGILTCVHTPYC